jgi:hypothetical protein
MILIFTVLLKEEKSLATTEKNLDLYIYLTPNPYTKFIEFI